MAEPFVGEIRLFSFAFAPRGWAQCDGALILNTANDSLFTLLGTSFGGNITQFALPDLRGRVPMGMASGLPQGTSGGAATHTLTANQIPAHSHAIRVTNAAATTFAPVTGSYLAAANDVYVSGAAAGTLQPLHSGSVNANGFNTPHENMQPYLPINFCIALSGIYPSRN